MGLEDPAGILKMDLELLWHIEECLEDPCHWAASQSLSERPKVSEPIGAGGAGEQNLHT